MTIVTSPCVVSFSLFPITTPPSLSLLAFFVRKQFSNKWSDCLLHEDLHKTTNHHRQALSLGFLRRKMSASHPEPSFIWAS